jgi:hypothetical protein
VTISTNVCATPGRHENKPEAGPLTTDVLPGVLHFAMAETITFRPDDDALRALAVLTKDGTTVSNALRSALIDAARLRAQDKLRSESAALAANEQDRAEAAQVLRDMETLRPR